MLQLFARELQHLETKGIHIERSDGQTLRGTIIAVNGNNLGCTHWMGSWNLSISGAEVGFALSKKMI